LRVWLWHFLALNSTAAAAVATAVDRVVGAGGVDGVLVLLLGAGWTVSVGHGIGFAINGKGGGRVIPAGCAGRLGLRYWFVFAGGSSVARRPAAMWPSHPRVYAAHSTGSRFSCSSGIQRTRATVVAGEDATVLAVRSNCWLIPSSFATCSRGVFSGVLWSMSLTTDRMWWIIHINI